MDITGFSNKEFLLLAKAMWHAENSRCFNGTLSYCPYFGLNCKWLKGEFMGCHYPNDNAKRDTIILSRKYLKTAKLLRMVLIHEMIHQEQAQHESKRIQKRHHDKFFLRRCIEICAITNLWVK